MRRAPNPRTLLLALLAATVPALLILNVWQGVRYSRLRQDVSRLEAEQVAWFEKNKSLLQAIGIYSSPRRLEALSEEDPGAKKAAPELRVEIDSGQGSSSQGGGGGR